MNATPTGNITITNMTHNGVPYMSPNVTATVTGTPTPAPTATPTETTTPTPTQTATPKPDDGQGGGGPVSGQARRLRHIDSTPDGLHIIRMLLL